MGYYINLSNISLDAYKAILKNTQLIPSWRLLLYNTDAYFEILEQNSIHNLKELLDNLKNKKKFQELVGKTQIPENYLVILKRAINSYWPKPVKIANFPGVSVELSAKLADIGINNTLKLYNLVLTQQARSELAEKLEVDGNEILKLTKLTDLVRIRWVAHTFARVLYESGYDTPAKVAEADHEVLYREIKELNQQKQLYKGNIGLNDMKICIESAREITYEIEY